MIMSPCPAQAQGPGGLLCGRDWVGEPFVDNAICVASGVVGLYGLRCEFRVRDFRTLGLMTRILYDSVAVLAQVIN